MSAKLSADEVKEITDYEWPSKQLAELHRMGFWRARRSPLTGKVILERAHYEAVCRGEQPAERQIRRPRLQPI